MPVDAVDELASSLPKTPTPAGLPEFAWAPLAAGAAILGAGAIILLAGRPWLLPSLGPTAFLIAELPEHPSARFYNSVVGHLVGLGTGFLDVALFLAWGDPAVLTDHVLTLAHVGAATVAIMLTMLANLLLEASYPPAAATTLLVALGSLKTVGDALNLSIGALLIAGLGIGLHKLRARAARLMIEKHHAEVSSSHGMAERWR